MKVTTIQKQIIAIFIPIVIVGGGVGIYLWNNQANLPLNKVDDQIKTNEVIERGKVAVNALKGKITKNNPDKLIYSDLTLEELKVYPENWVKLNFTKQQLKNQLIISSEADPDGDGINNKLEFLYGSNPNSAYTFCGEKREDCKTTDKDLVDSNRSPLTNLPLELPKKFRIKKVDEKIIDGVKDSISQAAGEGIDFPKLYELSRTLDLSEDLKKVDITTVKDTRDSYLKYIQTRLDILQENNQTDELSTFTSIYKLVDLTKITDLENNFKKIKADLIAIGAPESLANYHRCSVFVVEKTLVVINHRKQAIEKGMVEDAESVKKSQQNGKELFWGYRKLAEEQNKISSILQAQK
jgi:hypothetical protein